MWGVLINALAIVVGTAIGLLLKKGLKEDIKKGLTKTMGVIVVCVGVMDVIKTANVLFFTLSLALGGFIGALLHLNDNLERFGLFLEKKLAKNENSTLGKAFSSSVLVFCVGAMVVYGSIQAGLGDNTMLYVKAVLDGVISMILASNLGIGVMLSAIPVFVLQGAFALGASLLLPIITPEVLAQLQGLGGALVVCIGINLLEITKIKTADLIPAIAGCFLLLI
ncbi:MAG: DUF554 domain-containing protein [Clostridiales bacterium]|nr:DUF554 domain-containing protein [Clostridiales bacterium]